jgi:hypothetical protein
LKTWATPEWCKAPKQPAKYVAHRRRSKQNSQKRLQKSAGKHLECPAAVQHMQRLKILLVPGSDVTKKNKNKNKTKGALEQSG